MFKTKGKIIYDPIAGKAKNDWWDVSVVRDEVPQPEKQHLWKNHHEKEIELVYFHEIHNNGEYYWLNVECEFLKEMRKELGLEPKVQFGFHLTIGRIIQNN